MNIQQQWLLAQANTLTDEGTYTGHESMSHQEQEGFKGRQWDNHNTLYDCMELFKVKLFKLNQIQNIRDITNKLLNTLGFG